MKTIIRTLLAALLTLSLLLGLLPAVAEEPLAPSDKPIDMQVKVGKKIYTLAGPLSCLEEQGLSYVDPDRAKAGYWVEVTTGRTTFDVLLDAADRDNATPETTFVCGYQFERKESLNVTLPKGLDLATATRADVLAAYGTPSSEGDNYVAYRLNRDYVSLYFYFEEEGDTSLIKLLEFTSSIPYRFGCGITSEAATGENLPDPTDFTFSQFILDGVYYGDGITLQDLLDRGWVMDTAFVDDELKAQGGNSFFISGVRVVLYNGRGMMTVFLYNPAEEGTCKASEGEILSIGVNVADNTSLVVADGLTFGNTLDDVTATFGTNYNTDENDGYTAYSFQTGNVKNTFNISGDPAAVSYIAIQFR